MKVASSRVDVIKSPSPLAARHESIDHSVQPAVAVVTPKPRKPNKGEHNSTCNVCNVGGELLLCETCPLAYHAKCVRPKLEGKQLSAVWSCAYCVVSGIAAPSPLNGPTSNKLLPAARQGVIGMKRLSRGQESDDETGDVPATDTALADRVATSPRLTSKTHELTVSKSGKRFVVRKTAKSQIVELDRCNTLEEALVTVAAELNPIAYKKSKGPLAEKGELWCVQCLDDPSVMLCAFCGCRKCYGKHDSDKLLVCDGCDEEWHMSCLPKPMDSIPDSAWFCTRCCETGLNKAQKQEDRSRERADSQLFSPRHNKVAAQQAALEKQLQREAKLELQAKLSPARPKSVPVPGRGRGRPPGSSKKAKEALASAATAAAIAKGYPVDSSTLAMLMEQNAQCSFRGQGMRGVGANGSGLDLLTEDNLPPVLGAPGYGEAKNLLSSFPRPGSHTFHPTEKVMLSQMRTWAPLGDLELTRDALAMQCASVYRRIMLHDPFFKYQGMSSVLGKEQRHMLGSYEQDEDGLTDIANTDDLIDNDFELDAGNAAMVADAEKELSISSSYSSGSVNSGRSDEEIEEEEMEHSMPLESQMHGTELLFLE